MADITKIEITIISGTFLVNLDVGKKQDPYIWFKFNGVYHQTTVKDKAGLSAEWNEKFNIKLQKGQNPDIKFIAFD